MNRKIISMLIVGIFLVTIFQSIDASVTNNEAENTSEISKFDDKAHLYIFVYRGLKIQKPFLHPSDECDSLILEGEGETYTKEDFSFGSWYRIDVPPGFYEAKVTVESKTKTKSITLEAGDYTDMAFYFPFNGKSSVDTIPSSLIDTNLESIRNENVVIKDTYIKRDNTNDIKNLNTPPLEWYKKILPWRYESLDIYCFYLSD